MDAAPSTAPTARLVDAGGVFAAYARLSGHDRDVISLRTIAGFTAAQAAVGLGLTPAEVEVRFASAWRRLRAMAPGVDEAAIAETLHALC